VEALRTVVEQRGWTDTFVGGDQFVAWVEHEPNVRVSPDVYLVRPAPDPAPDSWQLWRPDHLPPRFAVEIVSPNNWRKDYEDNPAKYAQIGVDEFFIFDRCVAMGQTTDPERYVFQSYQREADGSFVKTYAGPGPVYSQQLDVWLLARVEGSEPRLRVGYDPEGKQLVPSGAEIRQRLLEERRARRAAELELRALREQLGLADKRTSEPSEDA
jgi:Uma2 family endonuclease